MSVLSAIPVADLISSATGIIDAFILNHKINVWANRLWRYGFSATVTFFGRMGYALYYDHQGFLAALGIGMLTASGTLMTLFMLDPDTRKMLIAIDPRVRKQAEDNASEIINKK